MLFDVNGPCLFAEQDSGKSECGVDRELLWKGELLRTSRRISLRAARAMCLAGQRAEWTCGQTVAYCLLDASRFDGQNLVAKSMASGLSFAP